MNPQSNECRSISLSSVNAVKICISINKVLKIWKRKICEFFIIISIAILSWFIAIKSRHDLTCLTEHSCARNEQYASGR